MKDSVIASRMFREQSLRQVYEKPELRNCVLKSLTRSVYNPTLKKRSDNDPLQNFDADANLDGLGGETTTDFDEDMPEFGDEGAGSSAKKQKTSSELKVFANTRDGVGKSTAGRNGWKEKHRKGIFSGKRRKSERKSERKIKEPLGLVLGLLKP